MRALIYLFVGLVYLSVGHGNRGAKDEEFPFQVSIQNPTSHVCGGVILTSRWVLTARKCVPQVDVYEVTYGSSDANKPVGKVSVNNTVFGKDDSPNDLALLHLRENIFLSRTAAKARIPERKVRPASNSSKISGWSRSNVGNELPTLIVVDRFRLNFDDCHTFGGLPIRLNSTEFCGYDADYPEYFEMTDMGTAVSERGIVIGILARQPSSHGFPPVFVEVSQYDAWIKETLGEDAGQLLWVDSIPKDSAVSVRSESLFCLLVVTVVTVLGSLV